MKRPSFTLLLLIALAGAVAGVVATACHGNLPPDYQLTDARVLAIRAEPPELVPGKQTMLDALVYTPPGAPAPSYTWSWCATVDAMFTCTTTPEALTQLIDPTGTSGVTIDYALGSAPTASFVYPANAALIRAACTRRVAADGGLIVDDDAGDAGDDASTDTTDDAGDDAGDAGGPGGLRCGGRGDSLTIYVLLTVTVGDKTIQAARQLTLYTETPSSLNTNPTIVGLAPFSTAADLGDAGALADPDQGPDASVIDAGVGMIDNGGLQMAADVPQSASELETQGNGAPNASGPGRQSYEALSLAWYVERGQLDHVTTTLPAAAAGAARDWNALLVDRWVPSADTTTTTFILIVRDDRGGVGWLRSVVTNPVP